MSAQQGLMNALAQHLEFDALQLDPEGQCTVTFDADLRVTFLHEEASQLTALGYITLFDPEATELNSLWLRFNFASYVLGGSYLALDAEHQAVVLVRTWMADRTDGHSFIKDIECFVNWMEVLLLDARVRRHVPYPEDVFN